MNNYNRSISSLPTVVEELDIAEINMIKARAIIVSADEAADIQYKTEHANASPSKQDAIRNTLLVVYREGVYTHGETIVPYLKNELRGYVSWGVESEEILEAIRSSHLHALEQVMREKGEQERPTALKRNTELIDEQYDERYGPKRQRVGSASVTPGSLYPILDQEDVVDVSMGDRTPRATSPPWLAR